MVALITTYLWPIRARTHGESKELNDRGTAAPTWRPIGDSSRPSVPYNIYSLASSKRTWVIDQSSKWVVSCESSLNDRRVLGTWSQHPILCTWQKCPGFWNGNRFKLIFSGETKVLRRRGRIVRSTEKVALLGHVCKVLPPEAHCVQCIYTRIYTRVKWWKKIMNAKMCQGF